jgi:hypothetical protein
MTDYREFATLEEAEMPLNEAAKQIGQTVFAVSIGMKVDGDYLAFMDNETKPPSKIVNYISREFLQSGAWHQEFAVHALDAALAVFLSRI